MAETSFVVSKEYLEDLGERDDDGYYDYAYCYWAYSSDFGDREYWARVYTDTPKEAGVGGPLGRVGPGSRADVEEIARYLRANEGVEVVKILGPSGYQPID